MKQQNDVNKQFSENNNRAMSSYITLIGAFIAIFGVYLHAFPIYGFNNAINSCKLLLLTTLVMIVLSFLASLSSFWGYGRRRDHVVACASSPDDVYSLICGNGKNKNPWNYLLGAYGCFFYSFLIVLILFVVFSIFLFYRTGKNEIWQCCVVAIIGVVSCSVPVLINIYNYGQYHKICERAKHYEDKDYNPLKTVNKNISINVNC